MLESQYFGAFAWILLHSVDQCKSDQIIMEVMGRTNITA